MAPQHVPWGNTTLLLDREEFRDGYELGRTCYFDEFGAGPSTGPQDWLHVLDIARTVLCGTQDGQPMYFDTGDLEHPLHLVGVIVGYVSSPLHPETPEEQAERLKDAILLQGV